MHEMSLCQNIMEIIDQQQKKHEIHEVTDIWLEIGALSCVEQSAVEFCFDASRRQPFQNLARHCLCTSPHGVIDNQYQWIRFPRAPFLIKRHNIRHA